MAKEILTWIIVGIYIAGVIVKIFNDRKRSKESYRQAAAHPAIPVTAPGTYTAETSGAGSYTYGMQPADNAAASERQTAYTFSADAEGVSSVDRQDDAKADVPMQAISPRRLSPRRRALRRTIIMGEMLAPKFDTANRL